MSDSRNPTPAASTPEPNTLQIAEAWQAAANAQDEAQLLALSHPEIEIVGPRGVARGREILTAWLERAGLTLTTRRRFMRGDAAVLAQHGVWRSTQTDDVQGEAELASSFRVAAGQVTHFARYDTLAEALHAAQLSDADEVLH